MDLGEARQRRERRRERRRIHQPWKGVQPGYEDRQLLHSLSALKESVEGLGEGNLSISPAIDKVRKATEELLIILYSEEFGKETAVTVLLSAVGDGMRNAGKKLRLKGEEKKDLDIAMKGIDKLFSDITWRKREGDE